MIPRIFCNNLGVEVDPKSARYLRKTCLAAVSRMYKTRDRIGGHRRVRARENAAGDCLAVHGLLDPDMQDVL